MPVIAIGAAVVADVIAGSALVGGTLTAFEAIAAVGATVAAVGAVTKSKPLQYAGMALGAIGGIGALAQSAGLLGTASAAEGDMSLGAAPATGANASDITSAFADSSGSAAGASGDILNQMTDAGGLTNYGALSPNDVAGAATGLPPAATNPTAGLSPGVAQSDAQSLTSPTGSVNNSALVPQPASGNAISQAEGNAPSLINTPGQSPVVNGSIGSQGTIGASGIPGSNASPLSPVLGQSNPIGQDTSTSTGNAIATGNNVTGLPAGVTGLPPNATGLPAGVLGSGGGPGSGAADAAAGAGGGGGGGGGLIGETLDFVKGNPLLAYGATQALGSFVSGMTSTVTPAQVAQLNAQAAANNAAAALVRQQTAAQAQPKSIASLAPVTGAPAPLVQNNPTPPTLGVPGSLMNGVTGAPA